MRLAIDIAPYDLHDDDPDIDMLEELVFGGRFDPRREERRIPTREELIAMTLEDARDDGDDDDEPPMTCNDAFRVIEYIKEREAHRRG